MYNNETNNFVLSDTDDIYNFVSEHEEEIIDLFNLVHIQKVLMVIKDA